MPRASRPALSGAALLPVLLLVLLPWAAQAQPAPGLHITGSGEFVARRDAGPRDLGAAADSDAVVMVEDPRIVSRASRIEARLCRRFGFMFTLENAGPDGMLEVTVTSTHPPIVHPSGRVSTGVTYPMAVSTERPGLVGFSFDNPWELVPGTWTFSVRHGNRALTEQRFEVVAPADPDPPMVRGDCSAVVS